MLCRISIVLVCLTAIASAQVTPAEETLLFRDGSNNNQFLCVANGSQSSTSTFSTTASQSNQPYTSIAKVNLVSIAVAGTTATLTTDGAHGYAPSHVITISGATVDTDLNGTYTIIQVTGTNFTVTVANVTAATYTEAGLKFTSKAPRTNANVWSIQKIFYTTTYPDRIIMGQADGSRNKACDSRTNYF